MHSRAPQPLPRLGKTEQDRLLARIIRDPETGCWVWQGWLSRDGYGQMKVGGRTQWAHRVSYAAHTGAIPAGLEVDHVCRCSRCVCPDHLRLLSREQNAINRRYDKEEEIPF